MPFGHELFGELGEDLNVSLGVGPQQFHDGAVVLLLEVGFDVIIDDFEAAGVFIGDLLLN